MGKAAALANALSERLVIHEKPHESLPMNAPGGLYMQVLCKHGRATEDEIYELCAPIAVAHGYNPDGPGMIGGACAHGIRSVTYAVWFNEKRTQ